MYTIEYMMYHERLKIETPIGVLHGLFYYNENGYTAWFEEKPMIVIEAINLNDAIDELLVSLDVMLDYETKQK